MHALHFPFAFITNTTLANYSGYTSSLIKFSLSKLIIYSFITSCLSEAKLFYFYFYFYLTSFESFLIFNPCTITARLTSFILDGL